MLTSNMIDAWARKIASLEREWDVLADAYNLVNKSYYLDLRAEYAGAQEWYGFWLDSRRPVR